MQRAIKLTCFFTLTVAIMVATSGPLNAQNQTVGLFSYDTTAFHGYTLFAPMSSTTTYLIDNYGRAVHSWENEHGPAASVYMLENGNLLRTTHLTGSRGAGGGVQIIAWDGTILWDYEYMSDEYLQHHDIEPLPNGNVLILAWEHKTALEAIAAGRNPDLLDSLILSPEHIVEVEPTGPTTGNIVWEWHVWDHLIQDFDSTRENYGAVEDHPELMDINYALNGNPDWIHANSISYNPELDQIMISCRSMDEIWVIDHSTTTEEAAGHSGGRNGMGGDILYRWGNPQVYRAGTAADRKLYGQHNAHWIKPGLTGAGNIMVYNNGQGRPDGNYSSVDEIAPPIDENGGYSLPQRGSAYGPGEASWSFVADDPPSFYSNILSGAQRLPNGNTLICAGRVGRFLEINDAGEIVWEYINPITSTGGLPQGELVPPGSNFVFRATRFAPDYPGLQGRSLEPGTLLERYPVTVSGTSHFPSAPTSDDSTVISASIKTGNTLDVVELMINTGDGTVSFPMTDNGSGQLGTFFYQAVVPPLPAQSRVTYFINMSYDQGSSQSDPPDAPMISYRFSVGESASFLCGDAMGDGNVNVGDVVFLINYIFKGGTAPDPILSGDANCDGGINVGDAVYILNYVFSGGPDPCCQ
jgi:hypothetical protein